MTETEGYSLPEGTPLRFKDGDRLSVGIFIHRTVEGYVDAPYFNCVMDTGTREGSVTVSGWVIGEWKYYTVITIEEFLIRKLEQ